MAAMYKKCMLFTEMLHLMIILMSGAKLGIYDILHVYTMAVIVEYVHFQKGDQLWYSITAIIRRLLSIYAAIVLLITTFM